MTDTFRDVVDPELAMRYRSRGFWGDETIADHVARHAAHRPGAPAIVGDRGTLDWRSYHDRARQLAAELVASGLRPGERIGVLMADGAAVHVTFVAAELAGLTVVGIGARAGEREIRHLLGRTGSVALATGELHRGRSAGEVVAELRSASDRPLRHLVVPCYEAGAIGPLLVDGQPVDAAPGSVGLLVDRRLGPDDLFLVNSTSGTTGLPKCVMHTQNRWMYFHQRAVISGDLTEDDVFLSAVPAPFGFGLWTAHFTPALLGAPVVVSERFSAERTLELIEREAVTVLCCVSTQFIMMLNSVELDRRDLSSLRVMFTGGEAIPYTQARDFEERTGCTVLQFFGSNETGLLSGTTLADPPERRLRTAGRVVDDMEVRLYSDRRRVHGTGRGQPAGRGPATCLGYLDDDEANAELFTDDGWMLMGDICTLDEDGWLTVVGRTSDIIIRGGKNISAAQVEEEVATHPAVSVAAAVAMPDEVFGERVCTYVELVDGGELDLDGLVGHLVERGVSKELLPERLIVLDALPRSSGGKVAKGQLRDDLRRRLTATSDP
jgi:acyl-CoA synthetase